EHQMSDELVDVTKEELEEMKQFFAESGAAVTELEDRGDKVTLLVSFADQPVESPKIELPHGTDIDPPDVDGYVLVLQRLRTEHAGSLRRPGGVHRASHEGQPRGDVKGFGAERPGRGENPQPGVINNRQIPAATYPLFTHAGDNGRYNTLHFHDPGGLSLR